jgi:hypothetical protein
MKNTRALLLSPIVVRTCLTRVGVFDEPDLAVCWSRFSILDKAGIETDPAVAPAPAKKHKELPLATADFYDRFPMQPIPADQPVRQVLVKRIKGWRAGLRAIVVGGVLGEARLEARVGNDP